MPHCGEAGWHTLRLQNRFRNTVENCVENFIDIPHTAFVHAGIFRSSRAERLQAQVVRRDGSVLVRYANERSNLGSYRWFLNPRGLPVAPVPVQIDNMARLRHIVRTTILHLRETEQVASRRPVELRLR